MRTFPGGAKPSGGPEGIPQSLSSRSGLQLTQAKSSNLPCRPVFPIPHPSPQRNQTALPLKEARNGTTSDYLP